MADLPTEGIEDLAEVKVTHLRAFLAAAQRAAAGRLEPRADGGGAEAVLPLPRRGGADPADPALSLRTPKKREALPDVLTMHELELLLAQPARGVWERHFPGKPERDRCCSR